MTTNPTTGPLTAAMYEGRRRSLAALRSHLTERPPASREDFRDMVQAAFMPGNLSPREITDDMGYSYSSVLRWIEGRTAPHPSGWATVTAWIVERIDADTS